MTDNEIIKALECCRQNEGDCPDHCPLRYDTECTSHLASKALTIINRKKAKIERLEKHIRDVTKMVKAEAVKEFAETVKANQRTLFNYIYSRDGFVEIIDKLVKEFTEGENT